VKICQICGKQIAVTSRAQKYCSEECRARVKYERNRAWLEAHPGKAVEYSRKWREENPERVRQIGRDRYRLKVIRKLTQ